MEKALKDFLSFGINEKKCVQLRPNELNPFLRVLETIGKQCIIEMKSYEKDLKKKSNSGDVFYYLVYPRVCDTEKAFFDKTLRVELLPLAGTVKIEGLENYLKQ